MNQMRKISTFTVLSLVVLLWIHCIAAMFLLVFYYDLMDLTKYTGIAIAALMIIHSCFAIFPLIKGDMKRKNKPKNLSKVMIVRRVSGICMLVLLIPHIFAYKSLPEIFPFITDVLLMSLTGIHCILLIPVTLRRLNLKNKAANRIVSGILALTPVAVSFIAYYFYFMRNIFG